MLKYALTIALGFAISGSAFAQDAQRATGTDGIASEFAKTDSGSGTTLDRLVGAIAAQRKAQTAYADAIGAKVVADSTFQPVAKQLRSREDELTLIPAGTESDAKLAAARGRLLGELNRAIGELRAQAKPLELAFSQKAEAAEATKLALDAADKEVTSATAAWQEAVLKPVTSEVTTLAAKLGTANDKLVEAGTTSQALTDLRQKVAEFCGRNPTISLCTDQAKLAQQQ